MGYHIAIVRTRGGQCVPITKGEVESLVASLPGSYIEPNVHNGDALNVVIAKLGKEVSWLSLSNGWLWAKNPEDGEIAVMIEVADRLGARVRGDEFETYRSVDETYLHPDDKAEFECAEDKMEKLVRRAKIGHIISWSIRAFALGLLIVAIFFSQR